MYKQISKTELAVVVLKQLAMAAWCRRVGDTESAKRFVAMAKENVRILRRRIWCERLHYAVTAFPKRIAFGA